MWIGKLEGSGNERLLVQTPERRSLESNLRGMGYRPEVHRTSDAEFSENDVASLPEAAAALLI